MQYNPSVAQLYTSLDNLSFHKMRKTAYIGSLHLYTSYYSGLQWPNQMYHPRTVIRSENIKNWQDLKEPSYESKQDIKGQFSQYCKEKNKSAPIAHKNVRVNANIELQADYLLECGGKENAQMASQLLGILWHTIRCESPEQDVVRILVKLSKALQAAGFVRGAFRASCAALHKLLHPEAEFGLEDFLDAFLQQIRVINQVTRSELNSFLNILPSCLVNEGYGSSLIENLCHISVRVFLQHHDLSNSERYSRLIPRTVKYNQQLFETRWIHYSPYDSDRCFALMDTLLQCAEEYYSSTGNNKGILWALRTRSDIHDNKEFNRRIYSGKITTQRGRGLSRANKLTTNPTAYELLCFNPSVHQPYFDYRYLLSAPVGRENEVWPGVNRTIENGDPLRRQCKFYRQDIARKHGHSVASQHSEYN